MSQVLHNNIDNNDIAKAIAVPGFSPKTAQLITRHALAKEG